MTDADGVAVAMLVLRAAAQVVEGIQQGLAKRGFDDVRPAHGFAFARISAGEATVADVAAHLGVTKQAGSQLVEHLVKNGYVSRRTDPSDGRSRVLELTTHGWECTRAAEDAAAETIATWERRLGHDEMASLRHALRAVVVPGRLRPAW